MSKPKKPNYGATLLKGYRTDHPDALWFPEKNMGLMITWGIHSVAGIQPSWAMIKDYPAGGDPKFHPPEIYYALADQWKPDKYDPEKWMAAMADAGFTYAVLIAKHHDGYTLWPSDYGDIGTHRYLGGRDLVQEFVQACRNNGLRVGLYMSWSDWYHPLGRPRDPGLDFNRRGEYLTAPLDKEKDRAEFNEFMEFTRGQLEELLTRYGKVDLFWWDGNYWPDPDSEWGQQLIFESAEETIPWMRELQPGIVINDRWGGYGDYLTPEMSYPDEQPDDDTWWELCVASSWHWGYTPDQAIYGVDWWKNHRKRCNDAGGNFLPAIGPKPDGTMPDEFYEVCREMSGGGG